MPALPFRNGPYPSRCDGRLTAVSGVPVPGGAGAQSATLYFTPYKGNRITLLVNNVWQEFVFPELSIANTGLGANDVRDVFIYSTEVGLALEFSAAWTGFVTRVDAITLQDGVAVKASDTTRRLLGTIMVSSATTGTPYLFTDTPSARLISNLYNAVPRNNFLFTPGADVDALTDVSVVSNGLWVAPVYLNNRPACFQWVACESRSVKLDGHVVLRTSTATIIGAGIGITAGDGNFDVSTINNSVRTLEPRLNDNLSRSFMTDPGAWVAWQAFFAEGGDGTLFSEITDKRRGATHDPALSWFSGWIDC